jgi:hypothetical protein
MLESQMEELIAKYPVEFFPRKLLTLTGRQGSFSGVGRFDLLFKDEHQTNILMELKARTAKYEDATQLAKYHDALKQQGVTNVLMWLVATAVPQSVREFLDRIGIEYTEIHESEYRAVALHHHEIVDVVNEPSETNYSISTDRQSEPSFPSQTFAYSNSSNFRSKLKPKYKASRDRFRLLFPVAYEFLKYIENHSSDGFWIGTSTNAHLYFNDSFLAYIQLGSDCIIFSPHYNNRIEGGTYDRHKLIFPDVFRQLVKTEDGTVQPWARFGLDGSVTIKKPVSPEFFQRLIDEIKKVHSSANAV